MESLDDQPSLPTSHQFTCLACHVAFRTADLQRDHYKSDWHCYNLKRKMANMEPVSASNFAQRLLAQQEKSNEEALNAGRTFDCNICKKCFSTLNAFDNHLRSKKHKETEQKKRSEVVPNTTNSVKKTESRHQNFGFLESDKDSVTSREPSDAEMSDADVELTEEERINHLVDERIRKAKRLKPNQDCIFCSHQSTTLEENVLHMTKTHSMFIPDLEYLVDMNGLVQYLADKVSVGYQCLSCNGRGKGFYSLEAVRKHMVDKGHCRIAYETEDEQLELSDYYDFSSSYPEGQEPQEDEGDADLVSEENVMYITPDESSLVLPSGVRIGNRSLRHIYRQNLPLEETRESVLINQLSQYYDTNTQLQLYRTQHRSLMVQRERKDQAKHLTNHRKAFDLQVGVRNNMLQKHFRNQIGFST